MNYPDNSSLRNCPNNWYRFCSNAPFACKSCCAGTGSPQSLLRFSLNKNLIKNLSQSELSHLNKKNHPIHKFLKDNKPQEPEPEINKALSKQVKEGYVAERKLADKINKTLIKQTLRSGAVNGDGDLKLGDLLQIDSKKRNKTKSFTVSWAEYTQGRSQGTNTWAITVTDDQGKEHTLMCLDLDTFNNLVARALENKHEP